MIPENFIKLYESSFRENWDLPALTDYNEQRTLTRMKTWREKSQNCISFFAIVKSEEAIRSH